MGTSVFGPCWTQTLLLYSICLWPILPRNPLGPGLIPCGVTGRTAAPTRPAGEASTPFQSLAHYLPPPLPPSTLFQSIPSFLHSGSSLLTPWRCYSPPERGVGHLFNVDTAAHPSRSLGSTRTTMEVSKLSS